MTYVLFAVLTILWLVLWSRVRDLEQSLRSIRTEQDLIPDLTRRVFALERSAVAPSPVVPAPVAHWLHLAHPYPHHLHWSSTSESPEPAGPTQDL